MGFPRGQRRARPTLGLMTLPRWYQICVCQNKTGLLFPEERKMAARQANNRHLRQRVLENKTFTWDWLLNSEPRSFVLLFRHRLQSAVFPRQAHLPVHLRETFLQQFYFRDNMHTGQTLHRASSTSEGLVRNRFPESANVQGTLPEDKTRLGVKGKLEPASCEQSKKRNVSVPLLYPEPPGVRSSLPERECFVFQE